MGYRADKEKVEKKLKVIKRISLGILLLCVVGLCIFSAFVPPTMWKYYVAKPRLGKRKAGEVRIHFLNVGQGDCSLIELPDGKVMLIDGGDMQPHTEKTVLRYLNALKIDVIDYLVVTHADEDHCGTLDVVLKYKKVLNAYLPPTFPVDGTAYDEVCDALSNEKCNIVYTSRTAETLKSENENYPYTIDFLYPYQYDVEKALQEGLEDEDDNDFSSVVYFHYQGIGALFAADINFEIEEGLVTDDRLGLFEGRAFDLSSTEILKVAHHGSKNSTSAAWLDYLQTKTAVISCGEGNVYGHPADELLARLHQHGAAVWRTDRDGSVMITLSPSGEYHVTSVK